MWKYCVNDKTTCSLSSSSTKNATKSKVSSLRYSNIELIIMCRRGSIPHVHRLQEGETFRPVFSPNATESRRYLQAVLPSKGKHISPMRAGLPQYLSCRSPRYASPYYDAFRGTSASASAQHPSPLLCNRKIYESWSTKSGMVTRHSASRKFNRIYGT